MSKDTLKKEEWCLITNQDNRPYTITNFTPTKDSWTAVDMILFMNVETGEIKLFAENYVLSKGIDSFLKELNK